MLFYGNIVEKKHLLTLDIFLNQGKSESHLLFLWMISSFSANFYSWIIPKYHWPTAYHVPKNTLRNLGRAWKSASLGCPNVLMQ